MGPTAVVTSGVPEAIASTRTRPNPSQRDGITTTSASAYSGATSLRWPVKTTRSERPRSFTIWRTVGVNGSSTAPAKTKKQSGRVSQILLAARTTSSGAFCRLTRPTLAITRAPGGMPREDRSAPTSCAAE
jgi:hypothetical protein